MHVLPLIIFYAFNFSFYANQILVELTYLPVIDYLDIFYMNAFAHCLHVLDHGALRFITNCAFHTHRSVSILK